MAERAPNIPLTEPVITPCLFASGVEVEVHEHIVRIVGWVELPTVEMDQPERRIIARLVMPNDVARELWKTLQRGLTKGGH